MGRGPFYLKRKAKRLTYMDSLTSSFMQSMTLRSLGGVTTTQRNAMRLYMTATADGATAVGMRTRRSVPFFFLWIRCPQVQELFSCGGTAVVAGLVQAMRSDTTACTLFELCVIHSSYPPLYLFRIAALTLLLCRHLRIKPFDKSV